MSVDVEGRQPSFGAAMPRPVIRMGQSWFITRSIVEGSMTLKGDTGVIIPEYRFERS